MKKKVMKTMILTFAVAFLFSTMTGFSLFQKPWIVPDADKNKVNPLKGDAASVAEGKVLYGTHCKSCHGTKGKGDGPKAAQLDTESGDFTKASFQSQTDGALFYKTSTGRDDMPSFKKKISDVNDIWSIVNYLRTLK